MSILRNPLKSNYSKIPNALICDTNLSAGAFRVAAYLFSKVDGWEVNNHDIKKTLGIGQNSTIAGYWKELLEAGWVTRERIRGEKNAIAGGYDYQLMLEPSLAAIHIVGNATLGDSQTHNNNDSFSKTEESNPLTPKGELSDSHAGKGAAQERDGSSRRPPTSWDAVLRLRATPSLDGTVSPSPTGDAWERRMHVFDAVRKKYPGTKAGLLQEFNGFLKKCWKDKLDLDRELSQMPYAVLYQIKWREAKEQAEEFAAAWKNFPTWINQAHWQSDMDSWKSRAEWFNQLCPPETKAKVEELKSILTCK